MMQFLLVLHYTVIGKFKFVYKKWIKNTTLWIFGTNQKQNPIIQLVLLCNQTNVRWDTTLRCKKALDCNNRSLQYSYTFYIKLENTNRLIMHHAELNLKLYIQIL